MQFSVSLSQTNLANTVHESFRHKPNVCNKSVHLKNENH